MRDFVYKALKESLDNENVTLEEKLPFDLANAYKSWSILGTDVNQQASTTLLDDIPRIYKSSDNRMESSHDLDKADYKVISKEEALKLVKDKTNLNDNLSKMVFVFDLGENYVGKSRYKMVRYGAKGDQLIRLDFEKYGRAFYYEKKSGERIYKTAQWPLKYLIETCTKIYLTNDKEFKGKIPREVLTTNPEANVNDQKLKYVKGKYNTIRPFDIFDSKGQPYLKSIDPMNHKSIRDHLINYGYEEVHTGDHERTTHLKSYLRSSQNEYCTNYRYYLKKFNEFKKKRGEDISSYHPSILREYEYLKHSVDYNLENATKEFNKEKAARERSHYPHYKNQKYDVFMAQANFQKLKSIKYVLDNMEKELEDVKKRNWNFNDYSRAMDKIEDLNEKKKKLEKELADLEAQIKLRNTLYTPEDKKAYDAKIESETDGLLDDLEDYAKEFGEMKRKYLKEDLDNENIPLEEKLPPKLAKAYKNFEYQDDYKKAHSAAESGEIPEIIYSRYTKYDLDKADYKIISKEEALDLIKDKTNLNANLSKMVFLFDLGEDYPENKRYKVVRYDNNGYQARGINFKNYGNRYYYKDYSDKKIYNTSEWPLKDLVALSSEIYLTNDKDLRFDKPNLVPNPKANFKDKELKYLENEYANYETEPFAFLDSKGQPYFKDSDPIRNKNYLRDNNYGEIDTGDHERIVSFKGYLNSKKYANPRNYNEYLHKLKDFERTHGKDISSYSQEDLNTYNEYKDKVEYYFKKSKEDFDSFRWGPLNNYPHYRNLKYDKFTAQANLEKLKTIRNMILNMNLEVENIELKNKNYNTYSKIKYKIKKANEKKEKLERELAELEIKLKILNNSYTEKDKEVYDDKIGKEIDIFLDKCESYLEEFNEIKRKYLKEDINNIESTTPDKKLKDTYMYKGPIYRFNRISSYEWEGVTKAFSEKQALNNLRYQAGEYLGLDVGSHRVKIDLDPQFLTKIEEEDYYLDDVVVDNKKPSCDECGTQLTDGGYCPKCDDGEEDY